MRALSVSIPRTHGAPMSPRTHGAPSGVARPRRWPSVPWPSHHARPLMSDSRPPDAIRCYHMHETPPGNPRQVCTAHNHTACRRRCMGVPCSPRGTLCISSARTLLRVLREVVPLAQPPHRRRSYAACCSEPPGLRPTSRDISRPRLSLTMCRGRTCMRTVCCSACFKAIRPQQARHVRPPLRCRCLFGGAWHGSAALLRPRLRRPRLPYGRRERMPCDMACMHAGAQMQNAGRHLDAAPASGVL